MKTKWILMILAVVMIWLIFSISQAADRLYFGSYQGKEYAHTLKDSLRFNIIAQGMDSLDIYSLAAYSLRAIVYGSGESNPTGWSWTSRYTLWEAEGFPGSNVNLRYYGGNLVNDDSASGGKAMEFTGPDTPKLIQSGPTYYQECKDWWEDTVKYTAEFRLKFLDPLYTSRGAMRADASSPVCSIMVMDMVSYSILKDTTIYEGDFGGGSYQTFELKDYTVPGWNQIEFQIYWYGITGSLYIDYVKVYNENGLQVMSGAKDSMITAYVSQDWTKTVNIEGDTVIYRWYMRDEPPSIDFYMPTAHIDSLLKQVSQERVGFQPIWQVAYPDFVHEYLLRQDPRDFCVDIYPMYRFGHDSTGFNYQVQWSDHIELLNFAETEAENLNKDFWLVTQAYTYADTFKGSCDYYPLIYWKNVSWCPHQRDPSRYELRLQTFLGLCYGADGILYFNYEWWIDGYGNLLTGLYDGLNDSTTYKWREIRDFIGPRMEVLGPIYAPLEWQGACLDDIVGGFVLRNGQPSYLDSIRSHNHSDEPHWVQVGFFENQSGDTSYFMLVNRECLATEGANYDVFITKTGGPYQIRDMYTDSIVDQVTGTGDYFTIYLGPGEGKLLRLESGEHGPDLFTPPVNYAGVPYYISDIFAADLDNDGYSDLAVTNYYYKFSYSHVVTIFKNRGDGAFDTTRSYFPGHCPWSLSAADYDKDGDKDLAVVNGPPFPDKTVSILENNGSGAFSYLDGNSVHDSPEAVISADFNNDGYYDLAVSLEIHDNVAVLMNDRYGWFEPAVYYRTGGSSSRCLFAADFNGDTYPDLAIPNQVGQNLSILINNGNGTFQVPVNYSIGNDPIAICGADFDKDGDCDLAIANEGESYPHIDPSISVFKNNGNGTFYLANNYVLTQAPWDIVTADFNLDGDFDLAFTSYTSDSVSVWLNAGDGTFEPVEAHFLGDYGPLVASDLNGDGAPDLAVGRHDSNDVAILINLSTNLPPSPFSLISPPNNDTILPPNSYAHVDFYWQESFDPEGDSIWYALYISRSSSFYPESTIIHANLLQAHYSDSLQAETYYWKVKASDKWGVPRWSNQTWRFHTYVCGDVNGDDLVNSADIVALINYLFTPAHPVPPPPLTRADCNGDGFVNSADIVCLINYMFTPAHPVPRCPGFER